jgi:protein-L-isoaspartate(D-aspartate) O-methyltransferase
MSMDIELARFNMVEQQVRPWEVLDARVLGVLTAVRREDYVPSRYRNMAFADLCLPIGHGEVMMKPVIEGRVLQAVDLKAQDSVLEIGTGSGFLSACLGRLAREVVSIEQHADLAEAAARRLYANAIRNVRIEHAEALLAFEPKREFDAIVVTGAVNALPARWRAWVKPGGRVFAVTGESPAMQATLFSLDAGGHWSQERLFETDLPYLTHATPPKRFVL